MNTIDIWALGMILVEIIYGGPLGKKQNIMTVDDALMKTTGVYFSGGVQEIILS